MTGRWHTWEIGAGEVCVGSKVDKAKINDELDDLEHSDVLLPPDANATGGLEIVPIHVSKNYCQGPGGHTST